MFFCFLREVLVPYCCIRAVIFQSYHWLIGLNLIFQLGHSTSNCLQVLNTLLQKVKYRSKKHGSSFIFYILIWKRTWKHLYKVMVWLEAPLFSPRVYCEQNVTGRFLAKVPHDSFDFQFEMCHCCVMRDLPLHTVP